MDEISLERWQKLHMRSVRDEVLTTEEQEFYDKESARMDAEEEYPESLIRLLALRKNLSVLEAEGAQLRAKVEENKCRIAAMEARLPSTDRQLLGIGS